MKTGRRNLLIAIVVGLVLISFAGCDLANGSAELDEISRNISDADVEKTEVPFSAAVYVSQVSTDTMPVGKGGHYQTKNEVLMGQVIDSDWAELVGAYVTMTNATSFDLIPLTPEGPYTIVGTNRSNIELALLNGETMAIKASGTIEGTYPVNGYVEMEANSVANGVNTAPKVNGVLAGEFVWYYAYLDPTQAPFGYFTLTGTYSE